MTAPRRKESSSAEYGEDDYDDEHERNRAGCIRCPLELLASSVDSGGAPWLVPIGLGGRWTWG